jgi:hypothetical protein
MDNRKTGPGQTGTRGAPLRSTGRALAAGLAVLAFVALSPPGRGPSDRASGSLHATPSFRGPLLSSAEAGEESASRAAGRPEPLVALFKAGEKNTVFLPTRAAPWPAGKNAVWCASLELAWRELAALMGGGRLEVAGDPALVGMMNRAPQVPLPSGIVWARAARRTEKAIEGARRDLGAAFPRSASLWTPIPPGDGYFSVAYLEAAFQFTWPFAHIKGGHGFHPTDETVVKVAAFGIPASLAGTALPLRRQVAVLYDPLEYPAHGLETRDTKHPLGDASGDSVFVLDLDRESTPFQILLARIPRKETLAATWAQVAGLIQQGAGGRQGKPPGLRSDAVLRVPAMHWDLEQDFPGLQGLQIENKGFEDQTIDEVYQRTRFRLDRQGVDMSSIATITTRGGRGREYIFHRPYLLALRARGVKAPFFLVYVQDASLLLAPEG